MSSIWDLLRARDSKGLSVKIANGQVDVNEAGAVSVPP